MLKQVKGVLSVGYTKRQLISEESFLVQRTIHTAALELLKKDHVCRTNWKTAGLMGALQKESTFLGSNSRQLVTCAPFKGLMLCGQH